MYYMSVEEMAADGHLKKCLWKTLTAVEDLEDGIILLFDGGAAIEILALDGGGFSYEVVEWKTH